MNAPLHRPARTRRPTWSAEEDALALSLLAPSGRRRRQIDWTAVLGRLPGRSRRGVLARFKALRAMRPGAHWTEAEDKILRDSFAEDSRRTLLHKLPGRSWFAIYRRATKLGFAAMPQGWEPIGRVADRELVDPYFARRLVEWANHWAPLVSALCELGHRCALAWQRLAASRGEVFTAPEAPPCGYDGGEVRTRLHTTTSTQPGVRPDFGGDRWITLVEEGAFELALARWLSWETARDAAERLGTSVKTVHTALARERFTIPAGRNRTVRLPAEWITDAVSRGAKMRLRAQKDGTR